MAALGVYDLRQRRKALTDRETEEAHKYLAEQAAIEQAQGEAELK